MRRLTTIVLLLFFLILTYGITKAPYNISEEKLNAITKKYGEKARKRVLIWDKIIESNKNKKTLKKLKAVNDFFNKITYKRDIKHWGKKDYWATPFQFMGTGAGDCEDYAIAKYFSLKMLGIPEEKLRITYVKLIRRQTKYDEAHMVLTYYHKPNSIPIVLDNINKRLMLASKRKDLKPIYSFNAAGLWKAQKKGKTSKRISGNNLKAWKDLMSRI